MKVWRSVLNRCLYSRDGNWFVIRRSHGELLADCSDRVTQENLCALTVAMSCTCQGHRKGHQTPRAVPEICHHENPTNTRGYKVSSFGIVLKHMKLGILISFVYKFPPIQRNFYSFQGKLAKHYTGFFTKITQYRLFSSTPLCSRLPVCIDTFTHLLLKFTHFGKYKPISSLKCVVWVSHILKTNHLKASYC